MDRRQKSKIVEVREMNQTIINGCDQVLLTARDLREPSVVKSFYETMEFGSEEGRTGD